MTRLGGLRIRLGGLRTRFIVAFVLAVAVVAGTTAAALVLAARSWAYTNAQEDALAEFTDEVAQLGSHQTDLTAIMRHRFPPDMTVVLDGRVAAAGTVDPARVDAGFAASLDTPGLVRFLRLDSSRILMGKSLQVVNPAGAPGRSSGEPVLLTVYAERPLIGVQDKLSSLAQIVAVTLTAGMVASGLFGWWLATTLVRPLRRLDAAAARAADGDLDVRLPEDGVRELGQVTGTFNEMMRQHGSAIDRLTESDQRSRRFVADVSHELRTPLAALVPMGEILREDADQLPPDTAAAARVVGQEIDKLARLVEDLIEMSRHDSGHARLDVSAFDLADLARETLVSRGWDAAVPVRAAKPVPVRADARRLEIVVANLVGNALRHGAEPVEVDVRLEGGAGGTAIVEVRDHGPGVPVALRQTIFQRFFKADTARGRSEGSGLGLALVAENARLHGGTIEVARVGAVTVFTLRLPAGGTRPMDEPSWSPEWIV